MIAVMMAAFACSSGGAAPTVEPTQSLIRFTPTATIPPVTPAPTPSPPPPAAEVLAATTAAQNAGLPADVAVQSLTESRSIAAGDVEVVAVEAVEWPGSRLACDVEPDARGLPRFDGYRVLLLAEETVYTYHADNAGDALLCEETPVADLRPAVRVLVDAVAADLVSLAQRRLAADLDLPQTRIDLVELEPVTWDDNSLGCPAEGVTYAPGPIVGYRIVLAAGDATYAFHTDFTQVMRCDR